MSRPTHLYDSHQHAAGRFYEGLRTEVRRGVVDAETHLRQFETAQRFFIDRISVPDDLMDCALNYAEQLSRFGLLQLPSNPVSVFMGPLGKNKDPNAPVGPDAAYYASLIWADGDRFFCRPARLTSEEDEAPCHATVIFDRAGGKKYGGEHDPEVLLDRDVLAFLEEQKQTRGKEAYDRELALHIEWLGNAAYLNLFGLCGTIECRGVDVSDVVKAPKFINAKRAAKGKPPLFSYRVLTIDVTKARIPGHVALGGSHASPRLHWRRGHIRRLASGVVTRVKPCLVGDVSRGVVSKEYAVVAGSGNEEATAHPD